MISLGAAFSVGLLVSSLTGTDAANETARELSAMGSGDSRCLWMPHIDYQGNDIGSVKVSYFGDCCSHCVTNSKCRAWTWTSYQGGTCWLKSAAATPVYSEAARSGLTAPGMYPSTGFFFAWRNCDIEGYDLTNTRASNYLDCFEPCNKNSNCLAYVWSNYNGGTCWLKSRVRPCKPASGQFTGIMARTVYYSDDL